MTKRRKTRRTRQCSTHTFVTWKWKWWSPITPDEEELTPCWESPTNILSNYDKVVVARIFESHIFNGQLLTRFTVRNICRTYHLWRYMLDFSMIKKSATLRAKRSIVLGLPIFDAVWLARPQFQCEFVYRVVMKERLLFYIFIYSFVCHLHTHTHTKINYSCLQQSIIITILISLHNNLYLIQIKLQFRVIYK